MGSPIPVGRSANISWPRLETSLPDGSTNSFVFTKRRRRMRLLKSFMKPTSGATLPVALPCRQSGPLPVAFAKQMVAAMGAWGWGMRQVMMDYNHWATLGVLGEILPWEDNRVELAEEKDQHGLPRREGHVQSS